jgi:2-amino-4-hydroxy-6-hydroxymethyldihydropteridine diphosphokinase
MAEPLQQNVFVGVGSNIKPERHILAALKLLQERVAVTATSTFYRTRAVRGSNQPDFYNGVWRIATSLQPETLKFDVLRTIEAELGRARTDDTHADRPIDLDLVIYEQRCNHSTDLVLPDPDIRRRAFLALPLFELAPALTLPDTGESIADIAAGMNTSAMHPLPEFTASLKALLHTHHVNKHSAED